MSPIVDVIAPASACSDERLAAGVATLERWGLQPRVPPALFARGKRGMFANTDEARLASFKAALRATDSRLLWCVRGGYGTMRLLASLAKGRRPRAVSAKYLFGFSDISALQLMVASALGVRAVHAPMLAQLGCEPQGRRSPLELDSTSMAHTRAIAVAIASGEPLTLRYPSLQPLNDHAKVERRTSGTVLGTNLETVRTLAGTPWLPSGRGAIWCFEDVGERGYKVDRALLQLELAGAFAGTRAVVFGAFTGAEEPGGRRSVVPQALRRFASAARFPVLRGLPIGHGRKNWPLPMGKSGQLCLGNPTALDVAIW